MQSKAMRRMEEMTSQMMNFDFGSKYNNYTIKYILFETKDMLYIIR